MRNTNITVAETTLGSLNIMDDTIYYKSQGKDATDYKTTAIMHRMNTKHLSGVDGLK
jgi:hypothetical protein